jgi:hypothetical protein
MGVNMQVVYSHLYDSRDRPVVTVATVKHENGIFTRGIAICSIMDIKAGTFSKKRGRVIARGRAMKAFEKLESRGPIITERAKNVMHESGLLGFLSHAGWTIHKACYSILPTHEEQGVFDELNRKADDYKEGDALS